MAGMLLISGQTRPNRYLRQSRLQFRPQQQRYCCGTLLAFMMPAHFVISVPR